VPGLVLEPGLALEPGLGRVLAPGPALGRVLALVPVSHKLSPRIMPPVLKPDRDYLLLPVIFPFSLKSSFS
jgi:hypothetical protein